MKSKFLLIGLVLWIPATAQTAARKQPESLTERACAGESAAESEV
jgi:hypothetical protein